MPDEEDGIKWKKKKEDFTITEDGLIFDSREEQWFYWQLKELVELGYIDKIERPPPFNLSESVDAHYKDGDKPKLKKKQILKPHRYTPDFLIHWNLDWKNDRIIKSLYHGQYSAPFVANAALKSYIEVKPQFDRSGSTTKSLINIKWLYATTGIYVQLVRISVQPGSWFDRTWTPKRFLLTDKTGKERKLKYFQHSLEDFLSN